jgi:SulP family sulfate permease
LDGTGWDAAGNDDELPTAGTARALARQVAGDLGEVLLPTSLRQKLVVFRGDLVGGFTAAVVMLAIEGSYGVMALAPLGPSYAPMAFMWAVYTAVICNLAPVLCGQRGPVLSGTSSPMSVLVLSLIGTLLAEPHFQHAGGAPDVALILAFAAAGVSLAGVFQVLIGVFGFGRMVKFMPYPVYAGFMNATAVLMVVAMLPHVLGVSGPLGRGWLAVQPITVASALTAAAVALRPPGWLKRIPPYLSAMVAGTLVFHGLRNAFPDAPAGPMLALTHFDWPRLDVLAPWLHPPGGDWLREEVPRLLRFAAALAVLGSLQTLMATSVIDTRPGIERGEGDRDRRTLLGQGMANLLAGVIGAVPGAASVSRTTLGLRGGATTRAAPVLFADGLLISFAFATDLLHQVPMAAVAGVFLAMAASLVDAWSRGAARSVLRQLRGGRWPRSSLARSFAAMGVVALVSITLSLTYGVVAGLIAAMLSFVRSNSRSPVRSVSFADRRRSQKVRNDSDTAALEAHGNGIAVFELDGALFFGTTDAVTKEIQSLLPETHQVILDFRRVGDVDVSGARLLIGLATEIRAAMKQLMIAGLPPDDPRTLAIREMDVQSALRDDQFLPSVDAALEAAEDRLLTVVGHFEEAQADLPLEQTGFGRGMRKDQIERIAAVLVERRLKRGEILFKRGERGEAMYVSIRGQIGIWLPDEVSATGWNRTRLVSFAPGVVFGEIALLQGKPRSADAVAGDDAVVLELTRENLQQLGAADPGILGRLFLNLCLVQAERLRATTDEMHADKLAR